MTATALSSQTPTGTAAHLSATALLEPRPPVEPTTPRPAVTVKAKVTLSAPKEILGSSPAVAALRRFTELAARAPWCALLTGETGTGKGLAAAAIHERSDRRTRPFITVNCAAVPSDLAESELFGHEKGAFTGASSDRAGFFEQADGGTLFLDELGTLSLDLQAKLLRAIESGMVRRLGSRSETKVDVRVIAATSADLDRMMKEGAFRPDLYYRVSKLSFRVPALRERPQDIPVLAAHLARAAASELGAGRVEIDQEAVLAFRDYPWAGNVRELDNHVSAVVAAAHFEGRASVGAAEVHDHMRTRGITPNLPDPATDRALLRLHNPETIRIRDGEPLKHILARVEHGVMTEVLQSKGGNKTHAALALGVPRGTFSERLRVLEKMIREDSAAPIRVMLDC